jgi:hypothetical protein
MEISSLSCRQERDPVSSFPCFLPVIHITKCHVFGMLHSNRKSGGRCSLKLIENRAPIGRDALRRVLSPRQFAKLSRIQEGPNMDLTLFPVYKLGRY